MPSLSGFRFPHRWRKRTQSHAALPPSASDYQYSPLNEEAQEIRLLRLLPGTFSSEIRVCLETTRLTEDFVPDFEALSYAWGSSENPVNIFIGESGNHTLAVTQNLAEALPYLRYKNKTWVLWIDAIAVNQQNLAERSSQVRRMADIYSNASQVLVWLGSASIDSSVALDYEPHWTDIYTQLPFDGKEFLALCNLLKRDWFGRLWIWQEVRLAKKAMILCGIESISWTALSATVFCLWKKLQPRHLRDNLQRIQVELLFNLCNMEPANFLGLIDYTKHSLCSDDKDRIFAILSLLKESEKSLQIVADYTNNRLEVYHEVVIRYIEHFKMLDIVSAAERHEDVRGGASWVPDWSVPRIATPIKHNFAGGRSNPRVIFMDDGILQVTGITIAPILLSERFNLRQPGSQTLASIAAVELQRINELMGLKKFVNERPGNLEDLTRVLCSNDFTSQYSPLPEAYPFVKESEILVRELLKPLSDRQLDMESFSITDSSYLEYVWMYCRDRSLFRSADGHIGLGPEGAKPGDLISVWLGCNSAMILRPTGFGRYLVIGEAYCGGLMDGSAFLGPLPPFVEIFLRFAEGNKMYMPTYTNRASGEFYTEDPRLKDVPLPEGWTRRGHPLEEYFTWFVNDSTGEDNGYRDPRLSPEALGSRGVKLQVFDLV